MEVPIKFMVERLKKLPNKAFITSDGNKVYAAVKDELVIFTGEDGVFNKMADHELRSFIRKNANKTGTPVEAESVYGDGDWFVDEQEGEEQIWELQFNIDKNEHEWVAIINPEIWKPRGRRVERPTFPGDGTKINMEVNDEETPREGTDGS